VMDLIPELMARSKGVLAFKIGTKGISVAMTNPGDLKTIHLIKKRVGQPVITYYLTKRDLQNALFKYKGTLKEEFVSIVEKLRDISLTAEARDDTVVKVVDMLLQYGHQNKASDIHIEPYTNKIVIRFRIDGVMHDVLESPKELLDFILIRIKILAKMRIDEHLAAQDGKFRFYADTLDSIRAQQTSENLREINKLRDIVDVRVSIVPIVEGENIVMRLLSAKMRQFALEDLGFPFADMNKVQDAIKNPHGMIVVTGPTGSGKTTTLYALMKLLNNRKVHVSTIEDPVEYDIEGISQIQVNTKTNLTFAKGLRAIVRQDPDIIMVGEIRDDETAGIAINSAMTGHLVLTTLHANDAATTLPRFLDMGVEPFLVASTVNVVIAQRLVRKICEKCRVSYALTDKEKKLISNTPSVKQAYQKQGYKNMSKLRLYKGEGCTICNHTGYTGRVGVFEVLEMTDTVKKLILQRASSDDILVAARKEKMNIMLEDGINKVVRGITTFEEVLRVTGI